MYTFIITLIVLVCALMILIVLVQKPKGGGVNAAFAPTQLMGVQRTTDLVEKITWGLTVALFVLVVGSSFMTPSQTQNTTDGDKSLIQEQIDNTAAPVLPAKPNNTPPQTTPTQGDTSK